MPPAFPRAIAAGIDTRVAIATEAIFPDRQFS
jgi:hypothetical protein